MIRARYHLLGVTAGLAVLGAALSGGTASAAPAAALATPSASDVAAARAAVSAPSTTATLSRFFASANGGPMSDAAVAAQQPRLSTGPTAVYVLDPGFVATGTGPVARLTGLATEAVAADGRTATVLTAKDPAGHWSVVNIATRADETDYAARAAGGTAFREPQLNAWYTVRDGRVLPLNDDARRSVGSGVSLAGYQKLVHRRYAGEMPGSSYDRRGLAGGAAAAPAPRSSSWGTPAALGLGASLLALVGLAGARRLRRAHRPA